jgi:hypothetical protein
MVNNQKNPIYSYALGVVALIIIGLSLIAIGKWYESHRPRSFPEINRGKPFDQNYFPLHNEMFSAVSYCVELELYLNDYPDTEGENVDHVGYIRIPDGSPLQLSYSCLNSEVNVELYDKEYDYYFDRTSVKGDYDDLIDEYRREYDNANCGSSIEFKDWLQLRFIRNTLNLYDSYLRDIYMQGFPGSEIDFETAVSRMDMVWGMELDPSMPGNLRIDYEYRERELKYTIEYMGFVMEDSDYMDVPARYTEGIGVIGGTLFENSEEE